MLFHFYACASSALLAELVIFNEVKQRTDNCVFQLLTGEFGTFVVKDGDGTGTVKSKVRLPADGVSGDERWVAT